MPKRRRPKIVGAIGWICAGLGYASFFMKGSQLPALLFPEKLNWINPAWKPPPFSRGQFSTAIFILLTEMLVGLVCMSGGLGALKLREWGRRVLIYYGIASIVLTLLKSAWQISMFDFMLDYQISMTTQPVDRTMAGNREFFSLIVSAILQLMWPLIVISLMTRRHIKDAFARLAGSEQSAAENWRSSSPD